MKAAVRIASPETTFGKVLSQAVASELLDREQRLHDGLEQRHRGQRAARFFEQQAEREEAEALAAVLFGGGEADQVRLRELAPELAIEAGSGLVLVDLSQSVEARAGSQDLGGQLLSDLFFFAELEVHGLDLSCGK